MNKRVFICILTCLMMVMLLVGCGGKETINDAADNIGIEVSEDALQKPDSLMAIPAFLYNVCVIVSEWAAVIIIVSILLGLIIGDVFKGVTEVRKWGLMLFSVKIPIIIAISVFGYKILYSVFNF